MKRVLAIAVIAMLVLPGIALVPGIAWAGSSRDAALAVGALAALGTILLGAAALAHPPVVVAPPVVYGPPPPAVVYAPPPPPPAPPVVYAPPPPVVYGPPPVVYEPPPAYPPAYRHGRYAYRRHHDWRY